MKNDDNSLAAESTPPFLPALIDAGPPSPALTWEKDHDRDRQRMCLECTKEVLHHSVEGMPRECSSQMRPKASASMIAIPRSAATAPGRWRP